MSLVTDELKQGVKKLFQTWSSPGAETVRPTVAETKLIGPQTSEARWPGFSVTSDEPKSVGGRDSAPPPSSLFVASIGFAENVIFARQAALQGVDFESYGTRVEGVWDRKGIFGIGDADPSITAIVIETRVSTNAPPTKVAELLRLTDQRCPMTATVAKAAKVQRRLFVNGVETPV